MFLKSILKLGSRCSLIDACQEFGIDNQRAHTAWSDAEACENLLRFYLDCLENNSIVKFSDLARSQKYKFQKSMDFPLAEIGPITTPVDLQPLSRKAKEPLPGFEANQDAMKIYFNTLCVVLQDSILTHDEFNYMKDLQRKLHLKSEQIKAMHGRAFLAVMMNYISDDWLDDSEEQMLFQLQTNLEQLGWAPGTKEQVL